MTDLLLAPADSATPGPDTLACGCCIAPPASTTDKVAALETRRARVEERLRALLPAR